MRLAAHPAVLTFALGNDSSRQVQADARVERFLRGLYDASKAAAP